MIVDTPRAADLRLWSEPTAATRAINIRLVNATDRSVAYEWAVDAGVRVEARIGLGGGTYRFEVEGRQCQGRITLVETAETDVLLVLGDDTCEALTIRTHQPIDDDAAASVTGRVIGDFTGVQVVAVSLDEPPILTPEGDTPGLDDGSFLIGELLPGRYEIQVQRDGIRVSGYVVTLAAGDEVIVTLSALPEQSLVPGALPRPSPSP